ncbi:ribosome-associated translation inhibitor RaiA [Roseococcus sp. SYP-B2431]|uniref:ribosome hibernation-promoting factor, HPF/YfiA family n=1 Tax=Roseococcus sp. SYP-B2431 TaxID=2496640 RepID=UPI00103C8D0C|nr:ribosome-associated translation inhibitor RaiA [Roseococcus sp. SYP-B2431]TCI00248.1 ribosome-associated translation inhibitor RaiA [Roseococcus sp. SYP-B2431]
MQITVAGKQLATSDALRSHVETGLGTITGKYFDHALEARVTFRKDAKGSNGGHFACDINLHAGRGLMMRGEGHGPDAMRAFDIAAEHVGKRLRRYRRRVNEHARSQAGVRDGAEVLREYVLPMEDSAEEEAPEMDGAEHPAVVAEPLGELHQLTVSEATMRLDLAGSPVIVFRNSASGVINVVYRRQDGHIGWIDPASA